MYPVDLENVHLCSFEDAVVPEICAEDWRVILCKDFRGRPAVNEALEKVVNIAEAQRDEEVFSAWAVEPKSCEHGGDFIIQSFVSSIFSFNIKSF